MQTIPSNLNAEELLRWYDSTWNKLTNSEMEERLAAALKEALDGDDELCEEDEERKRLRNDLRAAKEKIEALEARLDKIINLSRGTTEVCCV